jgi:hypothetical protein
MNSELKSYLEAMEQRMIGRILQRTQEMVRDAQTEVLRGFNRYQNAVQIRLRTLEADTSNIKTSQDLRLANLEERITAIEVKLMLGNHGTKAS